MLITTNKKNEITDVDDNWFDGMSGLWEWPFFKSNKASQIMKTDIIEMKEYYLLEVDLPGFDKKDINVDLSNEYLTVSAVYEKEEKSDNEEKYLRRERKYGTSSRSFYVGDIKESDIKASFKNGTLRIEVPKYGVLKEKNKKNIEIS